MPRIEAAIESNRCTLVCSPTGSGKSIMMSHLMRKWHEMGRSQLAMAPRRELIGQLCEKIDTWGALQYGLITADKRTASYAPFQIASVDTLVSRTVRRNSLVLPPADIVHLDEAHMYMTEQRQKLMELFPNAKIVGWTATPGRTDGKPLGSLFDKMVGVASIKQLIEQGYLVKPRYLAPSIPDMERVRTVGGDYDPAQSAVKMMPLLGDIIGHWMTHAANRRTVLFASNTQQSQFMAESFQEAGVSAEHCDGTADPKRRAEIFNRFRSGETQVLCNVDLATYGFDLPELDCIIFARPTKSLVRYVQMMGRGMRASPGKKDCVVLDHAGNVHYHGYVEEERYWSLSGIRDPGRTYKTRDGKEKIRTTRKLICPKCSVVFSASLTCPECGHFFEAMAQKFAVVNGQLIPIEDDPQHVELERMHFYLELKGHAEDKGYKDGWPAYIWKEKHKTWPPREWGNRESRPPSLATMRYLTYRNIRRSHGRERANS